MLNGVLLIAMSMSPVPAVAPWHRDYDSAAADAIRLGRDLILYFRDDGRIDPIWEDAEIRERLAGFVCLEVPLSYEYDGERLVDHPAFAELRGQAGIAIISFRNRSSPQFGQTISAHPFLKSRYAWAPEYTAATVRTILDLPAGSLTQRSLLFAVRVHPESPQSGVGSPHASFLDHAAQHSARQAGQQYQHHADIATAAARFRQLTGGAVSTASEVVAESWGARLGESETVLEAALSCVHAWRHSSAHWSAVSAPHRAFGYDMARGANGVWYATGVFGD